MRGSWETYWRCGYTVKGATDVIVSTYERTEEAAVKKANFAANDDIERIKELGLGAEITFWTQKWRTRQVEEFDDRVQVVRTIERRNEPREWREPKGVGEAVAP